MQGVDALLADDVQVRLPHIRANEQNLSRHLLADHPEEALERFDGALLADPQQPNTFAIDLIDQRQILVALGVLDLIHADGKDRCQGPALQAPFNDVFHCVMHPVPTAVEAHGHFRPGKLARPMRQKQQVRLGGMLLACGPGKLLGADAAIRALHAPPRVDQKHHKSPKGNEIEHPRRQCVITRRRFLAPPAHRFRSLARPYRHFDGFLVGAETGLLVDEARLRIALV